MQWYDPVIVPHVHFWKLFPSGEYADDSTLKTDVPSPGVRVTVSESLSRDLGKVIVSGVA